MTLFYVFCISAPIALLLTNLVRTGNNGAVKEAMERSGAGSKAQAPIAPRIKFAPEPVAPVATATPLVREETPMPATQMAA